MTPEEINALDALVKAATEGQWSVNALRIVRGNTLVCTLPLNYRGPAPADAAAIAALHNAAPALIAAAREVERLRAFVPVWTPVGNPDGDWRLSLGARELARVCPCGGGRWYPSNAATLDFATIGEAAAAVCARLGIPDVPVEVSNDRSS